MIDPKYSEKSSYSSRIAMTTALLLAGVFGLVTAFAIRPSSGPQNTKPAAPPIAILEKAEFETPPPPPEPVAAPTLVAFCSEHVTASRSFVIFKNDTCVVVNEPTNDPIRDARKRLAACDEPDAHFISEITNEGNLMVSFKEPVFHNFTPRQMNAMRSKLDLMIPTLLTPKEKAQSGATWMPPEQARFGLLARRKMLDDAANPVPVKVIRADQRATAQQ